MEHRTKAKCADGMLIDERTIAQELCEAGYATWMAGKWHLGQWRQVHLPLQRGFDHHYGFYSVLVDPFTFRRGRVLDWHRDSRGYKPPFKTLEVRTERAAIGLMLPSRKRIV